MQAQRIFFRFTRLLGKTTLWLLLALVTVVALIHIPFMQKQITRGLSNYLSSKVDSRVDIGRVGFSIFGNVIIEDLEVWDPHDNKIFAVHEVQATSSIINILTGDFIFDEARIVGIDGQLIQTKEGLNIQFILDAFRSKEVTTEPPSPIILQFTKIHLEDIIVDFNSIANGTTVSVNLGKFTGKDVEYSTIPKKIKASEAVLQNTVVNILSRPHNSIDKNTKVVSSESQRLSPDFGTGMILEIKNVQFDNNNFSFHSGHVVDTRKFDPSHIALDNIHLNVSKIFMDAESLAVGLQSLSFQLPGFTLAEGRAGIRATRDQFTISNLHLTSGTNKLDADLKAGYDVKFGRDPKHTNAEIAVLCQVDPQNLSYFFGDSLFTHFKQWKAVELAVEANYFQDKGNIKTLMLKTENSLVQAKGTIYDVFNPEKIYWKDMQVSASMGSDFRSTATSFVQGFKLPPNVTMQVLSSGNPKDLFLNGKVFTTWGDVKAVGHLNPRNNGIKVDLNLTGEKLNLREWTNVTALGQTNLSINANGVIGNEQNIEVNGLISDIVVLDQSIHEINFKGTARKNDASINVLIEDPNYFSELNSDISFASPLKLVNTIKFQEFKLGRLLRLDSSLLISGSTQSEITISPSSLEGFVTGQEILLQNQTNKHVIDSLVLKALVSPTGSEINSSTDHARASLVSNFDIRKSSALIEDWRENILKGPENLPTGKRSAKFNLELDNANLIGLLGVKFDQFSTLSIAGEVDEQKQLAELHATSGKLKGYGVSLDTMNTNFALLKKELSGHTSIQNLFYNSTEIGNLDFDILSKGDTAVSNLSLLQDSTTAFGLSVRILPTDSGAFVYADKLLVFDESYFIDSKNPVLVKNKNLVLNHFIISREDMQMNLNGDLNSFDVSLKNIDLTLFNVLLPSDSAVINKGNLTGDISYSIDKKLNLNAGIDSLSLYNSDPLKITATAKSDGNLTPFDFMLTNTSNVIDMKGQYNSDNHEVDATLLMDVNNVELFRFLLSDFVDDMNGTVKGDVKVNGPIKKPALDGYVQFNDVAVTLSNPKFYFNIKDDRITLDQSSFLFNDFTLYDKESNPFTLDGKVSTMDYEGLAYDLNLKTDQFTLLNKPDSSSDRFYGKLVIGSDIKLTGKGKDTKVEAKVIVKDETNLTLNSSHDEIGLLEAEGIIEFVDPSLLLDSASLDNSVNYYDSLIASLPDFNLKSTITVEDDAMIRVIIDPQSGDFIEASGGSTLELEYDRTGNLHLSGNYTVKHGVYRLSFYDLVKKNFTLVQGSSINWNGSPDNGDLNIKAVNTVESNSIGLIGHEIGENEKSIYKRSLDYEVGININGTIERPVISFSLDLPKEDKTSYPVLANKLDRLRQPEYESELNKQVFGLLVLGGFLPETSGSDVNSNLVATTALSNSVNSLLASQLNRFASQYIKGVSIDVGIQSFSDYSSPGGKTQTAMDFRVSKSVMNDRLSFEIGGDFDINTDQSGSNTGKNYRGDIAIIYDLTGNGDKQLKLFNNETYDIIYQEIRNTGISVIFIREFATRGKNKNKDQ